MKQARRHTTIQLDIIHTGGCLEILKILPDSSVHCCMTFPPYLTLPFFQRCNIVRIEASSGVYAAANLIDIRGNAADSGSELFPLRVVHLDDVAVNRHLVKINAIRCCTARASSVSGR